MVFGKEKKRGRLTKVLLRRLSTCQAVGAIREGKWKEKEVGKEDSQGRWRGSKSQGEDKVNAVRSSQGRGLGLL